MGFANLGLRIRQIGFPEAQAPWLGQKAKLPQRHAWCYSTDQRPAAWRFSNALLECAPKCMGLQTVGGSVRTQRTWVRVGVHNPAKEDKQLSNQSRGLPSFCVNWTSYTVSTHPHSSTSTAQSNREHLNITALLLLTQPQHRLQLLIASYCSPQLQSKVVDPVSLSEG